MLTASLAGSGRDARVGPRMRRRGPVAAAAVIGVAAQLATDRRRAAPQAPGDHSHRVAGRPAQRDLLTLRQRQATALQAATATRTNAAADRDPPRALLAIAPHPGGRVAD